MAFSRLAMRVRWSGPRAATGFAPGLAALSSRFSASFFM